VSGMGRWARPEYTPEREAVEAPPWRQETGIPAPTVSVWPHGQGPTLWVYVQSRWRQTLVRARHDHADGRVVYKVEITLRGPDGVEGSYARFYSWGQRAVVPASPATSPRPSR